MFSRFLPKNSIKKRSLATAIVTGANSGIGKAIASELARRGFSVILACRNVEAGEKALAEIKNKANNGKIKDISVAVRHLDLTSLNSVEKFAKSINTDSSKIDVLVNNAGILPPSKCQMTEDGFEITFQTNFLGHFLLTNLLLENLGQSPGGRVINTVADPRAFYLCWPPYGFQYFDPKTPYNQLQAYVRSKLAIALTTKALHNRMVQQGSKLSTFAADPGVIRPDLGRNTSPVFKTMLSSMPKFLFKNFEQGAETAVYCATQPKIERFSGRFFQNCKPITPCSRATDSVMADRLWKMSTDLVKKHLK